MELKKLIMLERRISSLDTGLIEINTKSAFLKELA